MENKGLAAFEKALRESEELQAKYEETMKRIADEGEIEDGPEAVKAMAAELGFELSLEEIEQALAEAQELDDSELEEVVGGYTIPKGEDEHGHDAWCWAAWHCHGVLRHTDTKDETVACWANYLCMMGDTLNPGKKADQQ